MITGVLSYFKEYSRVLATLHTTCGFLFSLGILFHISNNLSPITNYLKGYIILPIFLSVGMIFTGAYFQIFPFKLMMDIGAKLKANSGKELNLSQYEIATMDINNDIQLTIDLLRSEHYWHPQMAVWVEDTLGNYLESLFVSKATAQGLFFGGRSKDNFKTADQNKEKSNDYRRVDALPIWSHKRGVQYTDGMYVPTKEEPLPDAITGATFIDNFMLLSSMDGDSKFKLRIELNVAFDDNEYYSEYDFPDDEIFHNGTGQLGQPSILFGAEINMNDNKEYYLLNLIGHGHHSGQNGLIYEDFSSLTTALEIVERIVVGVKMKVSNNE
tara:strand:+ start:178 stop:1158 length:981 start_codon:yes stop_codon:yes gene_type:complete